MLSFERRRELTLILAVSCRTRVVCWTERRFWAFNAMLRLRLWLPVAWALLRCVKSSVRRTMHDCVWKSTTSASNGLDCCSHRSGHSNCIRVVTGTTLDAITRRKESVESLNEIRMPCEELRNSVDHSRRIDPTNQIVSLSSSNGTECTIEDPLTLGS